MELMNHLSIHINQYILLANARIRSVIILMIAKVG